MLFANLIQSRPGSRIIHDKERKEKRLGCKSNGLISAKAQDKDSSRPGLGSRPIRAWPRPPESSWPLQSPNESGGAGISQSEPRMAEARAGRPVTTSSHKPQVTSSDLEVKFYDIRVNSDTTKIGETIMSTFINKLCVRGFLHGRIVGGLVRILRLPVLIRSTCTLRCLSNLSCLDVICIQQTNGKLSPYIIKRNKLSLLTGESVGILAVCWVSSLKLLLLPL